LLLPTRKKNEREKKEKREGAPPLWAPYAGCKHKTPRTSDLRVSKKLQAGAIRRKGAPGNRPERALQDAWLAVEMQKNQKTTNGSRKIEDATHTKNDSLLALGKTGKR